MRQNPQPQEIYRHFKGNTYQVRCLAEHSESGEIMVVYQAMCGDFRIYVRPLASFMEEIDREKYPNAAGRYRFERIGGEDNMQDFKTVPDTERKETMQTQHTGDTEPEAKSEVIETETEEELNIDPLVLQFLDADSYEKRLEILSMLYNRIDDDMINIMAVAVDVEIKEGDIESRYDELRNCLLTFAKYECNRLR